MKVNIKITLFVFFLHSSILSQNTIELSRDSYDLTIDNTAEMESDPEIYAVTTLQLTNTSVGHFDLTVTQKDIVVTPYASSGTELNETDLFIKVSNYCESTDETQINEVGGGPNPWFAANMVNQTYSSPTVNDLHYIVGDQRDNDLSETPICDLTDVATPNDVNSIGSYITSTASHSFRVDAKINFNEYYTNGNTIKPGRYKFILEFAFYNDDTGGVVDTRALEIVVEILPILQLKINSPSQIDFSFEDINDYYAGKIVSGATSLEVSSNMHWDLFPVGTSSTHINDPTKWFWDPIAQYSDFGSLPTEIPLSALQIQQFPPNPTILDPIPGDRLDYSSAFAYPMTADDTLNNILVASGFIALAGQLSDAGSKQRAIAGSINIDFATNVNCAMPPGSFFLAPTASEKEIYRYSISYRIVPGIPTFFVGSKPALSEEATPGVYSMEVRYILREDQ
jgi:hypothetical protein